jgi:hypothetical protein
MSAVPTPVMTTHARLEQRTVASDDSADDRGFIVRNGPRTDDLDARHGAAFTSDFTGL